MGQANMLPQEVQSAEMSSSKDVEFLLWSIFSILLVISYQLSAQEWPPGENKHFCGLMS